MRNVASSLTTAGTARVWTVTVMCRFHCSTRPDRRCPGTKPGALVGTSAATWLHQEPCLIWPHPLGLKPAIDSSLLVYSAMNMFGTILKVSVVVYYYCCCFCIKDIPF